MQTTEIQYHLSAFDGPLDLLLHLIAKNKVSIYDIPIAEILEQYNAALARMEIYDLELESEFVAMSAQLLYIKSKMLLPRHEEEEESEDPRATLVQMLLEYQKFKEVSGLLSHRFELGRDLIVKEPENLEPDRTYRYSHDKSDLRTAILRMRDRAERALPPPVSEFSGIVGREVFSVGTKVAFILKRLLHSGKTTFHALFSKVQTRSEVVATFLAVLELCKSNKIRLGDGNDPQLSLADEE